MPIHPTAIIDPTAVIDESCDIGPYCRIEQNVKLGPGNKVMQGAVICRNTVAGEGNVFHYNSLVGGDPQFLGFDPETPSGTVIGNGNHFREYSQIHRGLKDGTNTVIGDGNFFMATSHVAHDCEIGNHNVMANYAGLAGHVTMGDRCFISTLVGVHQFCRVGSYAMLGGGAGISKDVPPYSLMKHYGLVMGINIVGLRRAGVSGETRRALQSAYRDLFRSSHSMPRGIEIVRQKWEGREMPAEVAHLLEFCGTRSKRGISRGPRADELHTEDEDNGEA
ncbi:MAG: acyl-ACP--UDP-N-acetylglucosamine O-acyltransferase [Candidatus Sumerlaeia bacterium]|nr:acyl-ACP--UDP-N-acetylglucosamine O-acyltransferase [Candidatus Sumerlaeia bacterium]